MYKALRQHPELRNDRVFDKEFRFFEKLLHNRPWGERHTITKPNGEALDTEYVQQSVRLIHELLRKHAGGPRGRYLTANPFDVFYIDYIAKHVPNARFIIMLRHPLETAWSMLNYKGSDWARRSDPASGKYDPGDVTQAVQEFVKVVYAISGALNGPFRANCMVLLHGDLTADPVECMSGIFRFTGLPHHEGSVASVAKTLHHSSFGGSLADLSFRKAAAEQHPVFVEAACDALRSTEQIRNLHGLRF